MLEVLESDWLTQGPTIERFEQALCEYFGTTHAVACSSGTAALHLAIKLVGVKEDDKVLCPSLTFSASANAILYEKAIPVFVDVEYDTLCIDPVKINQLIYK